MTLIKVPKEIWQMIIDKVSDSCNRVIEPAAWIIVNDAYVKANHISHITKRKEDNAVLIWFVQKTGSFDYLALKTDDPQYKIVLNRIGLSDHIDSLKAK